MQICLQKVAVHTKLQKRREIRAENKGVSPDITTSFSRHQPVIDILIPVILLALRSEVGQDVPVGIPLYPS